MFNLQFHRLLIVFLAIILNTAGMAKNIDLIDPTVKGAESEKELSNIIFEAIKANKFEMLYNYIPTDPELEYLRKNATERNKPLFENLEAGKMKVYTKTNFEEVIKKGIDKGINWSSTELIDYQTRQCNIEKIGCKVLVTIQDMNGKVFKLSYDIIEIKDKWFLFQGMRADP